MTRYFCNLQSIGIKNSEITALLDGDLSNLKKYPSCIMFIVSSILFNISTLQLLKRKLYMIWTSEMVTSCEIQGAPVSSLLLVYWTIGPLKKILLSMRSCTVFFSFGWKISLYITSPPPPLFFFFWKQNFFFFPVPISSNNIKLLLCNKQPSTILP